MNPHDQLFIRACRSKDPHKRVVTLYCRLYLMKRDDPQIKPGVCAPLLRMVDEYCPMSSCEIIGKLDPFCHGLYNDYLPDELKVEYNYWDKVLGILINKIRHADARCFPGLTKTRKFKKS